MKSEERRLRGDRVGPRSFHERTAQVVPSGGTGTEEGVDRNRAWEGERPWSIAERSLSLVQLPWLRKEQLNFSWRDGVKTAERTSRD